MESILKRVLFPVPDLEAQRRSLQNQGRIYDFRTNVHFTRKRHPMTDSDLKDFIRRERAETYFETNPEGRFRKFPIDEILARGKTNLDIIWIQDKSLADLDKLPSPDGLAGGIIESLQSARESFRERKPQLGC